MARKPTIDRDDAARPGTGGSEEAGAESISEGNPFGVSADVGAESLTESDPFAIRADVGAESVSEANPFAVRADVGQDALATALGGQSNFVEEAGHHLDDTLGQTLDTLTQQGGATAQTGADVIPELGGEQLAGLTEVDEAEDLNPNEVIES